MINYFFKIKKKISIYFNFLKRVRFVYGYIKKKKLIIFDDISSELSFVF